MSEQRRLDLHLRQTFDELKVLLPIQMGDDQACFQVLHSLGALSHSALMCWVPLNENAVNYKSQEGVLPQIRMARTYDQTASSNAWVWEDEGPLDLLWPAMSSILQKDLVLPVPKLISKPSKSLAFCLDGHLIPIFNLMLLPLAKNRKTKIVLLFANTQLAYSDTDVKRFWPLMNLLSLHCLADEKPMNLVNQDVPFISQQYQHVINHEHLYSKFIHRVPFGVFETDQVNRIMSINPAGLQLLGFHSSEMIGMSLADIFPDFGRVVLKPRVIKKFETDRKEQVYRLTAFKKNRLPMPVSLTRISIQNTIGVKVFYCIEDLSEVAALKKSHLIQLQRFKLVSDMAPVGILQANPQFEAVYVNQRWLDILHYKEENQLGLAWVKSIHPEDVVTTFRTLRSKVIAQQEFKQDCRFLDAYGQEVWVNFSAQPLIDDHQQLTGFIATLVDTTYWHKTEAKLREVAEKDALTGLANRALVYDRLTQALKRRNRTNSLALLCLDLDGFKNVNDTLGHEAGDVLLQEVSQRLLSCVRSEDTVARLGGDEFAILLDRIKQPTIASEIATQILNALSMPYVLDQQEVFISASLGITFASEGLQVDDYKLLFRQADIALYRAKAMGRNNFQYFSPELEASAKHRMFLGNELFRALERQEFEVYYQLQADLLSGKPLGSEALLRWIHPQRGILSPTDFLDILEETALIVKVSQWLWSVAFAQHKAWIDQGVFDEKAHLSVNVSPRLMRQNHLAQDFILAIETAGLKPHQVKIEITESSLFEDSSLLKETLEILSAYGIAFALDDFGTGYSSLTYLKRFPIASLKICLLYTSPSPRD